MATDGDRPTSDPAHPPRLVLVTANPLGRDLPAQELGLAAARDGWDVVVVSRAQGDVRRRARLGPVSVLQVPVTADVRRAEQRRRQDENRGILGLGFGGPEEREQWEAAFRARQRQRLLDEGAWRRTVAATDRLRHRLRGRAARWAARGPDAAKRVVGDWRRDHPLLLDLELALGPAVQRLEPDVVVADGIAALPAVAVAVARMRAAGRTVGWAYVARQHAGSTDWESDRATAAFRTVEADLGRRADAVAAPSREVAGPLGEQLARPVALVADPAGVATLCRTLTGLRPAPRPSVPASAMLQAVGGRRRSGRRDLPWRALGDTPVRLGLGTANFAGQLSAFAQALTTGCDEVSAEVVTRTTERGYGYPSDVEITAAELATLDVQLAQLRRVLPRYTHLLADAFLPVFGGLNGDDVAADLPALARAGVDVALLGHGSDVRDPLAHLNRVPDSLFRDAPRDVVDVLVRTSERHRSIAASAGLPVFVTTPDLLDDLPWATWVPLVVDVDVWATSAPVMERARPVVLHAPSQRWTKGTDRFLPALEALDEAGAIELRLLEGQPWAVMRQQVQEADVVVDQVAIGSYGTFACEAMAAGKPVLAHLTDAVTELISERTGVAPPLVNVTGDRVAEAVTELLDDRARTVALGAASADYARRVHDGRMSARVLSEWLLPDDHRA